MFGWLGLGLQTAFVAARAKTVDDLAIGGSQLASLRVVCASMRS